MKIVKELQELSFCQNFKNSSTKIKIENLELNFPKYLKNIPKKKMDLTVAVST